MLQLGILLIFACIACHLKGSLADRRDTTASVCVVLNPPRDCGDFCLTALKRILDYSTGFRSFPSGQAHLKESLMDPEVSIESKIKALEPFGLSENNEVDINNPEGQQKNLRETMLKLQKFLETTERELGGKDPQLPLSYLINSIQARVPRHTETIHSKYFYINNSTQNNSANTCNQIGGYLLRLKNLEELNAIKEKLYEYNIYWLNINF
ncbi:uncharacterized protein Dana_GF27985 [Drosophila ananassae]|uniref:Uncharacterized protein n=1 Tax=Drosophila ananassae TaxID=7217 RepID=A0A0P8XVF7_DROAN|nr:uncharacterized protein LOC26515394 [Drosophila ananassae]KPU73317.1 uncharacterized protein Dana_GF27985 [Drosophila ananassae]